jgi:hypothetical protein
VPLNVPPAVRAALVKAGYFDCGEMRRNAYAMIEGCTVLKNHLDVKRVLIEIEELEEVRMADR